MSRAHGDLEAALRRALGGEVRFDAYSRHLYATDASIYAIEPVGVVFPRNADDVAATLEISRTFGVPVLPRGAGTGLCGQTVGQAVVIDFSRFMHAITALDAEQRIARVQPGVVQDDLNRAAGAHGLLFAPDTSTSNRATLGGMVGNNSCGSRSARYGMTIDHVESLDVILADGSRARLAAVDAAGLAQRGRGNSLEARLFPREQARYSDEWEWVEALKSPFVDGGRARSDRLVADVPCFLHMKLCKRDPWAGYTPELARAIAGNLGPGPELDPAAREVLRRFQLAE